MLGKTNGMNPVNTGLSSGDVVCWYWGRRAAGADGIPATNASYAYSHDYFSYSGGVFTVLKDFTGNVRIVGSGTRNGSSGISGNFPLTYTFLVRTTTVSSGEITYTGNGTPDAFSYSFKAGDTVRITAAHTTNTYLVDAGFMITMRST
jgi:hypothetical protein